MAFGGAVSRQEFSAQKKLIKALLGNFEISPRGTRVGLIHYGNDATLIQSLKDSYYAYTTLPLIDRLQHGYPGSNLVKVYTIANQMYSSDKGARSESEKLFLVFADNFREADVAVLQNLASSLLAKNVRVIMVGFKGYIEASAVRKLLGSGRNPVLVASNDQLNDAYIITKIMKQIKPGFPISFNT